MNGANNLAESDRKPLHLCPTCFRKLCWNLRVEPVAYSKRLEAFCRQQEFTDETEYYRKAIEVLERK